MRNQRGQLTIDFLFALVLILGFTGLLFVLTFTLSMASITQYITYAAARNYVAAHLDEATQIQQGQAKYQELIGNAAFKPLFTNGWFKVDAQSSIGDQTQIIPGYQAAASGANEFWGVGTHFVAAILDFHIPFFGSTVTDGSGSAGFTTYMGSYLGREPSAAECLQFTTGRWSAIQALAVPGGAAPYSTATTAQGYVVMADNGC